MQESLWPFLINNCTSCHREGGAGSISSFVVNPNSFSNEEEEKLWSLARATLPFSTKALVESKARGFSNHGGGMRVAQNSPEEALIKEWVARAQEERCSFTLATEPILQGSPALVRLSPIQIYLTITTAFGTELGIPDVPSVYIQEAEYQNRNGFSTTELHILKEYFSEVQEIILHQSISCSTQSCAENWLWEHIRILIRRPLSNSEKDVYRTILAAEESIEAGLSSALLVAFLSPQFLFRNSIDSFSILSKQYQQMEELSYFLWDAPPTKEILDAISEETWDMNAIESLLSDPKTAKTVARVHRDWLGAGIVLGRRKDTLAYPDFDAQQAQDILNEFLLFSEHSFINNPTLEELFTAKTGWINHNLASIYNVEQDSEEWIEMILPKERGGILSRAAIPSSHTTSLHNLVPHRGHMLMRRLLCQNFGLAPFTFFIDTIPPNEPMTAQEMIAMHQANAVCASCHTYIDPFGLALESYDAIGYWNSDIDTSGNFTPLNIFFENIQDLQSQLILKPELHQCYAQVWLERVQQHSLTEAEIAFANQLGTDLFQHNGDIRYLLKEIIYRAVLEREESP